MMMDAYSVFDIKAGLYGPIVLFPNTLSAIRWFGDVANEKGNAVNRHPSDYMLMQVGQFDDNTGEMVSFTPPKSYGLASTLIEAKPMELPFSMKDVKNGVVEKVEVNQ